MRIRIMMFLVPLLVLCTIISARSDASDAASFYKGKTVTLFVNSKPGGGTDYGARLLASHWSEYTGGTMVVKNEPGGGGLVALNKVYTAEPDGLTIGTAVLGAHVVTFPLFKRSGVMFDPMKFHFIGHFAPEPYSFSVGKDQPYKSIEDMKKAKGLILGAPDPVSTPAQGNAILIEFFGLDGMTVPGFRGGELGLAAAKGEIVGYSLHGSGLNEDMEKGFIKSPLVTIDVERSPWFPDVPCIGELIKVTSGQERILDIFSTLTTGKVFFAPPGVPEDRAAFLRNVFVKMATSQGFISQAKQRWKVWSPPTPGEKVTAMVRKVISLPKEDVDAFTKLSTKYTK